MLRRRHVAGLLLAAHGALLFAQEDAVVITASRTEQRLRDAIPHTTVITQRDIRDSQAVDLVTLLRREAGFEMAQNGGIGATYAPLSLRGGRGSQVLVLVDGVRMEDAAFSQSALQHIMLDEIERVEIVRGNVSSLYGSGAIGGVIQIFTRQGRGDPAAYGDAALGSRGTNRQRIGYGGAMGEMRFNVTASRFETRGFSAMDTSLAPIANPDADGYRNEAVAASLSHKPGRRHEIGVSFFRSKGRLDYDGNDPGFVFLDTPATTHDQRQTVGAMRAWWEALFIEGWKSRVTVAQGDDERTDFRDRTFVVSSDTRTRQLIWDNDLRLAPEHLVSVGVEQLRQHLASVGGAFGLGQRERQADAVRLGYLGRLGRHSLQANVRREDYSDSGKADTHFLGYGFDLTDSWRLMASHATAFRAPTLTDLYSPIGGNPALRPERARTNEVGVQWAAGTQRLRVVRFETKYIDFIDFLTVFPFTASNVGRASVTGIESSYVGTLWGAEVGASLTLQDPVQQNAAGQSVRAVRRAEKLGALSVHRSVGRWRLGGDLVASGDRRDTHIATFASVHVGGYAVLNLMARYNLDKALFAALRLENALDEKYQLVHGFNTPRRGVFLTVGWQP